MIFKCKINNTHQFTSFTIPYLCRMNWKTITDENQLDTIIEQSYHQPQVLFKHSTRCSISSLAKSRLDSHEAPADIAFHYLDLLTYRPLSNKIAQLFDVAHESPQVLLIRNGKCIYDESHNGIIFKDIIHQASKN